MIPMLKYAVIKDTKYIKYSYLMIGILTNKSSILAADGFNTDVTVGKRVIFKEDDAIIFDDCVLVLFDNIVAISDEKDKFELENIKQI